MSILGNYVTISLPPRCIHPSCLFHVIMCVEGYGGGAVVVEFIGLSDRNI